MKILFVSATVLEIAPLFNFFNLRLKDTTKFYTTEFFGNRIDILITGVGSVNMTYYLTELLAQENYDLILNIGFAGAFDTKFSIGEIFNVKSDCFADLGIWINGKFYTVFEFKLADGNEYPFENQCIKKDDNEFDIFFDDLKKVSSITVNKVSDNIDEIKFLKHKFSADIETMEGAAFMFVSKMKKVNFLQIRTISNYVKPRDEAQWNKYKAQIALYEYIKMKILEIISKL